MRKILCAVGTRPEAIKMAPVIQALKAEASFEVRVLATAQHRELLDQVFDWFQIDADIDLNIMQAGQTLAGLTARLFTAVDEVLEQEKPDMVVVQGDTTTVMVMALAAFYRQVPVAHVEAGLRTQDLQNPFPEELNRVVAGKVAALHFAPTQSSADNLLQERTKPETVLVTGNTVIDALHWTAAKAVALSFQPQAGKRLILLTTHRRENFGEPMQQLLRAIRDFLLRRDDVEVVFPVHPNPNVQAAAQQYLSELSNCHLVAPLDYPEFVQTMKQAHIIVTDSGGVQEEGPALGKPVLVMREATERPEAIDEGVVRLVGQDPHCLVAALDELLDDATVYQSMAKGVSPYGDGHAAERIVRAISEHFI